MTLFVLCVTLIKIYNYYNISLYINMWASLFVTIVHSYRNKYGKTISKIIFMVKLLISSLCCHDVAQAPRDHALLYGRRTRSEHVLAMVIIFFCVWMIKRRYNCMGRFKHIFNLYTNIK